MPLVPTVKLGKQAFDVLLVSARAELTSATPSSATIQYDDDVSFTAFARAATKVGDELELSFPTANGGSQQSVFVGDVVAIGIDGRRRLPRVTIEARDVSHRFGATTRIQTWQKASVADVVKTVADFHDLTAEVDAAAGKLTFPYQLAAETDAALLDRLARHVGCEWAVLEGRLVVRERPSPSAAVVVKAPELHGFHIGYDGAEATVGVVVTGWAPDDEATFHQSDDALTDVAAAVGSDAPFVATQHDAATDVETKKLLHVGTIPTADADEAGRVATGVQARRAATGLRLELAGDLRPDVTAGAWIKLEDLATSLDGNYWLTRVVHEYGPTEELHTTMYSEPPPEPLARASDELDWGRRGPVLGIVTSTADEQSLGRVLVKFPSLGNADNSAWARVVTPGSGADRGLDMRPQIDDVVLVVFEHGDTRFPLVLGGVWTGKVAHADPDVGSDDAVKRTGYRSTKGSRLVFNDEDDTFDGKGVFPLEQQISSVDGIAIVDSKKVSGLVMSPTGVMLGTGDEPIVIKNGKSSITMKPDGTIEVVAEKVNVKTKSDTTVKADGSLTVEGVSKVLAKSAGTKLELTSSAGKLESAGQLTVKGAIVKIN